MGRIDGGTVFHPQLGAPILKLIRGANDVPYEISAACLHLTFMLLICDVLPHAARITEAASPRISRSGEGNYQRTIGPGKLADMVLVSDDLFSIPAEKIRDAKVLKAWVGGKLVFSQEK